MVGVGLGEGVGVGVAAALTTIGADIELISELLLYTVRMTV